MKAGVVMLKQDPHDHILYKARMEELKTIARACGYEIHGEWIQTRVNPDPKYLIGKGKVEEISGEIGEKGIQTLIFWNTLKSRQKYDLEKACKVNVIDRGELILNLFERNARTPEASLQIKLAILKKQFPYERYKAWIRFATENPGPKALGEYAYKEKIRGLREMMRKTEEKLEKIKRQADFRRKRRSELGKIVALTGFYNAGKSTLFNRLTKGSQEVADYPFTTLASKVSRFYYGNGHGFLVDSIGLVQDMDLLSELIASFELTLADIKHADLVICMIDYSEHPLIIQRKLSEAITMLEKLGVRDKTVVAFNKIDRVRHGEKIEVDIPHVYISAKTGDGVDDLVSLIGERLGAQ